MMGYEEKMDAMSEFIAENQEYTEDDINELKEEIRELVEVVRVIASITRQERMSDRTLSRFIIYMKRVYGLTEEDLTKRTSWMKDKVRERMEEKNWR